MGKTTFILLLLTLLISNLPINAQLSREQLRTLPSEITDAKLVGNDLYVSTVDGLYFTSLDSIDFRRLSFNEISRMTIVGERVFYDSWANTSFTANYCNGAGITSRTTLSTQSAYLGSLKGHNSITIESTDISTSGSTNIGLIKTSNGVVYSRIYRTNCCPGFYVYGNPVAFDRDGNRIGQVDIMFDDFASDENFYYAIYEDILYRSESPLFEEYEILSDNSAPTQFTRIFHVNGQLISIGYGFHISEDQGKTWKEFDYPHPDLAFTEFNDGLYYFTDGSEKLKVSSTSFLSTEYDTIYNLTQNSFLTDRKFIPLNSSIFLAVEDNAAYLSYDIGETWNNIFTGLWHSWIEKPAVTDESHFFKKNGHFWRTKDNGLNFVKLTQNFTSNSGSPLPNQNIDEFRGHRNTLFSIIENEDNTLDLFKSIDQGSSFQEVFDENIHHFFNGVDNVFTTIEDEIRMSEDDGENWSKIEVTEIGDNAKGITDIQQASEMILIEYLSNAYYVSYDNGLTFSRLKVSDVGVYRISLINERFFAINNRGKTWVKSGEAGTWIITNQEPSFYVTNPNQSSSSATKIFSIGDKLYSKFSTAGYIYYLCNSTGISAMHYSIDFGKTWRRSSLAGNFSFNHGKDHYRYSNGFYKYGYEQNQFEETDPDLSFEVTKNNLKSFMRLGDTINVEFIGANVSTSDIDTLFDSKIILYKAAGTKYINDTLSFENFSIGQAFEYKISTVIDSAYSLGGHHLKFEMDIFNSVSELDEENNSIRFDFEIIPPDTIINYELVEICLGASYNGIFFEKDTILETRSEDLYSIDIHITEIIVTPPLSETIEEVLCEGSTVSYNNIEYNSQGIYLVDSLQSNNFGCDSLVFLNITEIENFVDLIYLDLDLGGYFDSIQLFQDTFIIQEFTDSNGCDSIYIFDISIGTVNTANQIKNYYSIFPNPTNNLVQISASENRQIEKIEIIDITGKIITQKQNLSVNQKVELDLSTRPPGVYFVSIYDKDGIYSHKIIRE